MSDRSNGSVMTVTGKSYVDSVVYAERDEEGGKEDACPSGGGEDSSYDSDCDNEASARRRPASPAAHDGVSRTASDTLGAEFAEYVTASSTDAAVPPDLAAPYNARVEFGLKLGYSERLVLVALQKLGPNPAQNELLAELIRLGAQSQASGAAPSRGEAAGPPGPVAPAPAAPSVLLMALAMPLPQPPPATPSTSGPAVSAPADRSDHRGGEEGDAMKESSAEGSRLRPIVVDGSNVAMSHGNKEVFSCRGIKLCVDWFKSRGHKEITVFVPKWRKEASRPYHHITDQEILNELERERLLVFTPSRLVGGKRMVCYDDRYVLRLAAEIDGIVVSNDNYRDLAQENPEFRKVVEERILMYSFVNDRFMPPDDPLGRSGPTLDNFLSYQPAKRLENPPPCPYGKKCTYGNKCRFHHPERGPLPHKSVTERLLEHAQKQLQEVKARASMGGISGAGGDHIKGKSLSLPLQPVSAEQDSNSSKRINRKKPLSRTRSTVLNSIAPIPLVKESENHQSQLPRSAGLSLTTCSGIDNSGPENGRLAPSHKHNNIPQAPQEVQSFASYHSPSPGFSALHHHTQVHPIHCRQQQWGQLVSPEPGNTSAWPPEPGNTSAWPPASLTFGDRIPGGERPSDTERSGEEVNLHRKLQRQLTLNPNCDPRLYQLQGYVPSRHHRPLARHASGETHFRSSPIHQTAAHQNVTRIASAPDSFQRWPLVGSRSHGQQQQQQLMTQAPLPHHHHMQRLSSTSDPQLNLGGEGETTLGEDPFEGGSWFPYTSEPPPSIWSPRVIQSSISGVTLPLSHPPYSDDSEESRRRLHYHLSSIFPEDHVRMAMDLYPDETNPQKICAAILSMFPKS
ncbi:endoribonuclease ZC3H12A-like isoform X2 [Hetaerina americana]|uniref:endoribonuclease ZC3H12A-like isoform X2 n=1 Tax=Hetaerina americana TaxID=62018 RepID=UPI003A7F2941